MRFALLGDPVAHSRSPAIHRAALAAAGIEGRYEARTVDAAGLHVACAELRAGLLDGANVTMPLKREAAAAADHLDPVAARGGVVNTLLVAGGEVIGHTTDVAGIGDAWEAGGLPAEGPVLVLGAGGAAAAALLALEGRAIHVSARRPGEGSALADAIGTPAREMPWGAPCPGAVLVNATPLGMHGEALPAAVLEEAAGLFDMAYGEQPTPAVRTAAGRIPYVDGLAMLVAQAARSFELWTGLAPDRVAMDRAARS